MNFCTYLVLLVSHQTFPSIHYTEAIFALLTVYYIKQRLLSHFSGHLTPSVDNTIFVIGVIGRFKTVGISSEKEAIHYHQDQKMKDICYFQSVKSFVNFAAAHSPRVLGPANLICAWLTFLGKIHSGTPLAMYKLVYRSQIRTPE